MRTLYFDCFSGISGDMTLAALVDAGANPKTIETQLLKLPFEEVKLSFEEVIKKGVSAKKLHIFVKGELISDHPDTHVKPGHHHPEHDHHHHHNDHGHEGHDHHHHSDHNHDHNDDHHHHRKYSEIVQMIEAADLPLRVKMRATEIFKKIGIAEAKIHSIPLETVHFHEVGAVDSIVDIVGTAIALEDLQIGQIYASPIALGTGSVRCDHGLYPVPAPATLEMMKGIPIRPSKEKGELTTPTGAGIISALVTEFGPIPPMIIREIGYGAGTKDLAEQPNVLRVVIGET
jgi:uncharacterized protein (DUF111 family)